MYLFLLATLAPGRILRVNVSAIIFYAPAHALRTLSLYNNDSADPSPQSS